jgi:hypothetical protein
MDTKLRRLVAAVKHFSCFTKADHVHVHEHVNVDVDVDIDVDVDMLMHVDVVGFQINERLLPATEWL